MEVSGTDLKAGEPVIVEGGYNLPEKTAGQGLRRRGRGRRRSGPAEAATKEHAEAGSKEGAKS